MKETFQADKDVQDICNHIELSDGHFDFGGVDGTFDGSVFWF